VFFPPWSTDVWRFVLYWPLLMLTWSKDAMPLIHRMVLIRVSTNDQVPLELPLVWNFLDVKYWLTIKNCYPRNGDVNATIMQVLKNNYSFEVLW
jgi:hypothetical protein